MQPAGLNRRVIAWILDGVLLGLVFVPLNLYVLSRAIASRDIETLVLGQLVGSAVTLAYFAFLWNRFGASLGQRVLGLRTLATDGSRLRLERGVVRWAGLYGVNQLLVGLGAIVTSGPSVFPLASLAWSLYLYFKAKGDPQRRGPHDHWAESIVVRGA